MTKGRINKDTVIGIVGAAVLVAAMFGVFQYEKALAAERTGAGAWTPTALPGPGLTGTTALGAISEETVDVTQLNLTEVVFTLTWTAQSGSDTMTMTIVPPEGVPGGENFTVSGDSGTLSVTVPVPNVEPSADNPGRLGAGEWQVSVQFTAASGMAPSQVPVPVNPDTTVSWTLATSLTAYEQTPIVG